jgi:hypothetical protein
MAAINKRDKRLKLEFIANKDQSIHAGLVLVEAMALRFGLWKKIRQISCLDPRRDKRRGYGPEVIIGQLIYALCTGNGCLSDSEALNKDRLAVELFGVKKFADQSQVGQWLREQSEESVAALRKLLREFVEWVIANARPNRLLHAGKLEVFFDDTQLEVYGKNFEGARINYNGDCALSWQTLWVGPLLVDSHLESPGNPSSQLLPMLERNRNLWKGRSAHFYCDSASSAGMYLDAIDAEGWSYTVSYNKWPEPLYRAANDIPEWAWEKDGEEYHAFLRHQPQGCKRPHVFVATYYGDDLLGARYGYIACDGAQDDATLVAQRHKLKGEKEHLFSEVLSGLDLHRPACSSLMANQVYYLIAAIAYNLMTAIKLLDLGDECQIWRLKTLIKQLMYLPGRLYQRSRQWVARVMVSGDWLGWWQRWVNRVWPEYGPGRPRVTVPAG